VSTTILNFFEFFATASRQPLRPLRNPRKIPARFPLPGPVSPIAAQLPAKVGGGDCFGCFTRAFYIWDAGGSGARAGPFVDLACRDRQMSLHKNTRMPVADREEIAV
jgi:hypothetical protein